MAGLKDIKVTVFATHIIDLTKPAKSQWMHYTWPKQDSLET